MAGQQLADGTGQGARPVVWILLGPSAGRVLHRAGAPGRAGSPPVRVEQDGLHALGADVGADQVAHARGSLIGLIGGQAAPPVSGPSGSGGEVPGLVMPGPALSGPGTPAADTAEPDTAGPA